MLTKKITSFKSKTKKELDEKIRNFNQKIYDLDIKNKEISTKIECFKDILQYFENQKKANKLWHLFWNFNKEINEKENKIIDWNKELTENEINIQQLKKSKLDIFEEITKLQDDLYQSKNDQYKVIFNKLNIIRENQGFKTVNEFSLSLAKNPFDEDNEYHDREIETNKNLREQKAVKSWQITCFNIITFGIFKYYKNKKNNKQIKILKSEIRDLSKELAENEKNIQRLKKLKLNNLEEIKTLQDNIFIKIDVNNLKEINQILTTLLLSINK